MIAREIVRRAAWLSSLVYQHHASVRTALPQAGLSGIWLRRRSACAWIVMAPEATYVAVRGTHTLEDVITDLSLWGATRGVLGRVHGGFSAECDALWPAVRGVTADLPHVVCCGHSLGGAVATLLCGMLTTAPHRPTQVGLVTFGAPRAGGRALQQVLRGVPQRRYVLACDPVPLLPPLALGYRHTARSVRVGRRCSGHAMARYESFVVR